MPSALWQVSASKARPTGLKPLSGNVCLRPEGASKCQSANASQTPLGERVPSAARRVRRRLATAAGLKPLSGNVCLRPLPVEILARPAGRSQTPLGERVPSAPRPDSVSNGSRNRSQTPLGERVPSANFQELVAQALQQSLKPLSGNVCLRPRFLSEWAAEAQLLSQTPLGERVPSATYLARPKAWSPDCLKPLSGNVCLRPHRTAPGALRGEAVSNPSRGTCAFGPTFQHGRHGGRAMSQTPLGERVPSAIRGRLATAALG